MPSVCVYYGDDQHLDAHQFKALGEELVVVIERCLGTERSKIQIMPVALAHTPFGTPVYIEIKARDTKTRTDDVLEKFIGQMDDVTSRTFGHPCRIRYFRYPAEFLAAAN